MLLGHVAATPGGSSLQRTLRRISVTATRDLTCDTTRHSGDFPLNHQALSPQVIPLVPFAMYPGLALTPAKYCLPKVSMCLTNEMLLFTSAHQLMPSLSDGDVGVPFPDPEPGGSFDLCNCLFPSQRAQHGPPAASPRLALVSSSCFVSPFVKGLSVPSTSFHPPGKNGLA